MSSFFSGKVIWITGASSGIGEALVHGFAKEGARIVLSARDEQALKKVASDAGLTNENHLIIPFDLADTSRAHEYVAQVVQKFSRIDYLVNNGGVSQRSEALLTDEKVERHLMEVNFFGHVALSKAVLPQMIKQGGGHITVVSSIAGKFGFFLRASYSAAKHALHGYFESLRLENEKHKVQVLLVCPGKISTGISLKAATADGSKHGVMDETHKNAVKPDECAGEILRAIRRGRLEVFIGGKEIWAVAVKRFFPSVFYRIIRRQTPF
jgi:dehydrogenase/reductase SDR family member 7B